MSIDEALGAREDSDRALAAGGQIPPTETSESWHADDFVVVLDDLE